MNNSSAKYYQNKKEKFQKRIRERCQNISEKKQKKVTVWSQYKKLPKHEKQRLVEYRRKA